MYKNITKEYMYLGVRVVWIHWKGNKLEATKTQTLSLALSIVDTYYDIDFCIFVYILVYHSINCFKY